MAGKSHLTFDIDAEAIAKQFKDFADEVQADLQKGVEQLARLSHANILMELEGESSAIQMQYKENLSKPEEISPGVWVVTLDQAAFWIEEGIPAGADMKKWLLKPGDEGVKFGKNGPYRVIPFKHDAPPSRMSDMGGLLAQAIKKNVNQEFGKINKANVIDAKKSGKAPPTIITATKIEMVKDAEGNDTKSPRTGLLHKFNFGGPNPGKGNTPAMDGVSVYQTKKPDGSVRRDIFTFRTVSANQADKWIHPGFRKKQFLDKAMDHANTVWETEILPAILRKWE